MVYSYVDGANPDANIVAEFEWIVVFGAIAACFAAFGIGANDVANAYATSVGSKALTIKQACALAIVFEFLGAVLAGNNVADTIRKGIGDSKCFDNSSMDAPLLMYGNLCVVGAVGFWLLLATFCEMPVSTTHSCVGGMIGMTIVLKGSDCVFWFKEGNEDNLYIPKGVMGIVLSWVFSPVLSAVFAVLLFLGVRTFILRSANSFPKAVIFYPILVCLAVFINTFFILSKGISKKMCSKGKDSDGETIAEPEWICRLVGGKAKPNPYVCLGLSLGIGIVVAALTYPLYKKMEKTVNDEFAQKEDAAAKTTDVEAVEPQVEMAEAKEASSLGAKAGKVLTHSLNSDAHASIKTDATVAAIHENAEKFDAKTEAVFRYIQIFTAILDSFAHGANDVANAMGPFMAIYAINKSGAVSKKSDTADDGIWILVLGGIFIGLGLVIYGHKIMRAIGVKLAVITPSRGFAIELGAAIVIIMGSYLGLPLSTTHCQVGATTGVALLEGGKGVNKFVLFKTAVGWVITLIVAGIGGGLLVAQGVHAPLADGPATDFLNAECTNWAVQTFDGNLKMNDSVPVFFNANGDMTVLKGA